jgi:hypothetical protein
MSKNIETSSDKLNKTLASRDEAFNMMSNGTAPAAKGFKDPNRKKAQKNSWKETEASVSLHNVRKAIDEALSFGALRVPRLKDLMQLCVDLEAGSAKEVKRLEEKAALVSIPDEYKNSEGKLLNKAEYEAILAATYQSERNALKSANKEQELFSNSTITQTYRATAAGFVNADNAFTKEPTSANEGKLKRAITAYKDAKGKYDAATASITAKVEAATLARNEKSNEAVKSLEAFNRWLQGEGAVFHKIVRAKEGTTRFEEQINLLKTAIATLNGTQTATVKKEKPATEKISMEERLARAEALLKHDHEPQMPQNEVIETEENNLYITENEDVRSLLTNEDFCDIVDEHFLKANGDPRKGMEAFVNQTTGAITVTQENATRILTKWHKQVKA